MMYELRCFYAGEQSPRDVWSVSLSADVLNRVGDMLAEHPGCNRIYIFAEDLVLFALDNDGRDVPL